jgi:hypothetical protein
MTGLKSGGKICALGKIAGCSLVNHRSMVGKILTGKICALGKIAGCNHHVEG